MALLLFEHANKKNIDILKVIKMLLIHDLVEIDNGDTWLYDKSANIYKSKNEKACAERLFSLLPDEQNHELMDLWQELENKNTKEALFAASIDGVQPLINHLLTGRQNPDEERLSESTVVGKKEYISEGSNALWEYSKVVIKESVDAGLYERGPLSAK